MFKVSDKKLPFLTFRYINWEGKTAVRKVKPIKLWYGHTQWHPKDQWLLKALDVKKGEKRDFAVKEILKFL